MNNIRNAYELREEILRLRKQSDKQKTEIRNSFNDFKNSLTPIKILLAIISELNHDKVFNSALSVIEKVKEYFKKK